MAGQAKSAIELDFSKESLENGLRLRDTYGRKFFLIKVTIPSQSLPISASATGEYGMVECSLGGIWQNKNGTQCGIRLYEGSSPFPSNGKLTIQLTPDKEALALVQQPPLRKSTTIAAQTQGVKIWTNREGIYAITHNDIVSAGASPSSINPVNIHLFSNGKEIPIVVETATPDRFNDGDKILFYGTHEHGINGSHFAEQTFSRCYYLVWDNIPGLRAPLVYAGPQYIDSNGLVSPFDPTAYSAESRKIVRISSHFRSAHLEEDNRIIRVSTPDSVRSDNTNPETIEAVPDDYWMWVGMCSPANATGKTDIPFSLDCAPHITGSAGLKVAFFGYGQKEHAVQIFLNNTRLSLANGDSTLIWTGQKTALFETPLSPDILAAIKAGSNTLSVIHSRNDCLFLNWIKVDYNASTKYAGTGGMTIKVDSSTIKERAAYLLQLSNFPFIPEIWDKGGRRYTGMRFYNGAVEVYDVRSSPAEYFITDSPIKPEKIRLWRDTTLTPSSGGANLLIIGPSEMRPVAAEHSLHRLKNGITSFFAPIEAIYDKFGNGSVNPISIKEYIAHAYTSFNPKPAYLLILGDASELSDKRERGRNIVPTLFTQVNGWGIASADSRLTTVYGDDIFPDIAVGRIPGRSVKEIRDVLIKIQRFENNPDAGTWRNNFFLIGGYENIFTSANNIFHREIISPTFNVVRADADPTSDYFFGTATQTAVSSFFNKGALFTFFFGHGGGSIWSDGRPLPMMDNSSAKSLSNAGVLPIVFSLTCLTASFEAVSEGLTQDLFPPLGETMLLSDKGGCAAFYGASGHSFTISDKLLSEIILTEAASKVHKTVGGLINAAEENMLAAYGAGYFHVIAQYNLLGDPSMPIAYPGKLDDLTLLNPTPLAGDSLHIKVSAATATHGEITIRIYGEDDLLSLQHSTPFNGKTDTVFVPLRPGRDYPNGLIRAILTSGNKISVGEIPFSTGQITVSSALPFILSTNRDTIIKSTYSLGDSIRISCEIKNPNGFTIDSVTLYYEADTAINESVLPSSRIEMLFGNGKFISGAIFLSPAVYGTKRGITYCISVKYRTADNTTRLLRRFFHCKIKTPPDLAFLLKDAIKPMLAGRLVARLRFINQGLSDASPFTVALSINGLNAMTLPYNSVLPSKAIDSLDFPIINADGYLLLQAHLDNSNNILESDKGNNIAQKLIGIRGTILGKLDTVSTAPYGGLSVKTVRKLDTIPITLFQEKADIATTLRPYQNEVRPLGSDSVLTYSVFAASEKPSSDIIFSYQVYSSNQQANTSQTNRYGFFRLDTISSYWHFIEGTIDSLTATVSAIVKTGMFYTPGYTTDAKGPTIRAMSAGRNLDFPDFIPTGAPIDILFEDNSAVDTSTIQLFTQGMLPLSRDRFSVGHSGGAGNAVVSFRPFRKGSDSIYAVAKDINNNRSDTMKVGFTLSSRLALRSFANHPNPFGRKTIFAFTIEDEADVELRIYTFAGYLAKTLSARNILGYQEIAWDATDKNGRLLPNGTYYVKFSAKGKTGNIERIFKIAKAEGR